VVYAQPDPTPAAPSGGKKQWSGKPGGQKKADFDPRLTEKDFAMAGQNALNAATATVTLEVQQRAAAGGVFPESEVIGRVSALTEQFYQATIARRKDMERPVTATAPAATDTQQAVAAVTAGIPGSSVAAAPAQPVAVPAPAPAQPVAPVATNPARASLPYANDLFPFGKYATDAAGNKGVLMTTLLRIAEVEPSYLHWVAQNGPQGKFAERTTAAGRQQPDVPIVNRVIEFLNAAEAAGNPVPNPPKQ